MKNTTRMVFYSRFIDGPVGMWLFAVNKWLTNAQVNRIIDHVEAELAVDGPIENAIRNGLKLYAAEKNLDYRISTCWELDCEDMGKMPHFNCDYMVNLTQWIVDSNKF